MAVNRLVEIFPEEGWSVRRSRAEEDLPPPWLFQHEDLINTFEGADTVGQETLTNTLNHINFMDGHVLVLLRHPKYQESILAKASPGPCLGKELTCRWSDENLSGLKVETYQFLHLVIDDGLSVILVPAVLEEINRNCFIIQLPTTSYVVGQRQARRYVCHGVDVELSQNGFLAGGELLDFSPAGFRVRVSPVPSGSFRWLNPDELVNIHLKRDKRSLFSSPCQCIRQQGNLLVKEIVLATAHENIIRFEKRDIRNPRPQLVPSPTLLFEHPLLKKRVQFKVLDISTSGFSVYEKPNEGILMPGMLIPELINDVPGASRMKCSAQVIYRLDEKEKGIRCGLAILDMDINTYSRMAHLVTNALDPDACVSSDIDMEALWEFFFKSGFIYPMKYRHIQAHRGDFKETYRKFYQDNPEIAKHFIYRKNGRICANISLVRAYERAWLIQHHSARVIESRRSGFLVLKQIMHYLNDLRRLPSAEIDYAMTYFQPENKIPNRIFAGFAGFLNNPRGSSLELFSYLLYSRVSRSNELPGGWSLGESSTLDLWELNRFYRQNCGGLLLDAMNLNQANIGDGPLEELYDRLGFLRKQKAYSLKHDGELDAILIVDQSDPGLNLSELLNSIKILVTNPQDLPWEILSIAISKSTGVYSNDQVPVLFYPSEYVKTQNVPYEKQYQLWILNLRYGNDYMEYMQKNFRVGYK